MLVAEAVDEVVHERLRRDVAARQPAAVVGDEVRDRVQEVRLAEARVPVDEERVVGLRRGLGDGERGRVGKAVRRPDHERVEGVLRVDAGELGARGLLDRQRAHRCGDRLGGRRRGRHALLVDVEPDAQAGAAAVADGRADQVEEVALDPLAREFVRDGDDEGVAVELEARDLGEPGGVGLVVECSPQSSRDVVPEALRRQLDLALHSACTLLLDLGGARA